MSCEMPRISLPGPVCRAYSVDFPLRVRALMRQELRWQIASQQRLTRTTLYLMRRHCESFCCLLRDRRVCFAVNDASAGDAAAAASANSESEWRSELASSWCDDALIRNFVPVAPCLRDCGALVRLSALCRRPKAKPSGSPSPGQDRAQPGLQA